MVALIVECSTSCHGPIIKSEGSKTNMNGTMKPAAPTRTASHPDFHKSALARLAAA